MKIRSPWLIKAVGFAVSVLVRLWIGSVRYHYRPLGPNMDPNQGGFQGRYLYAFWHEYILLPASQYGRSDIWVLISQHADGRLIAEACRHLGFRVVAGSSTRGGVDAVRRMLRRGRHAHLAVTPDGPRGPRRRVQPGLIYLAARTGLPIVPIGFGLTTSQRLKTWDRFALPLPNSAAYCVTTELIHVPADADKKQLEEYRVKVEAALEEACASAEAWAERERSFSPMPTWLSGAASGQTRKPELAGPLQEKKLAS